eukprot:CAMPEP_0185025022 /NCGR_PEP_ID=MMETSP1103-20130426/8142_1 /TAXON_ID=36769 /ORGANISM="Paraphysomonas bandaiensis, Strain Caron Lab Isolate" /LENGTH=1076 /DNA_ID=CAMNT_0027558133 /DNA_START=70 /DNA_END=3300 /DNA_ORIENTATION=-
MKSGYLIKLAMGSGRNWKKRYFMLNGNTFTYYVDHKSVDKAKGDLLLTAEASVEESVLPGKPFCIMITTPFHTLVVAAKDAEERDAWRVAIEKSIMVARNSIRGYITKKGSLADGGKSRKFFILHEAAITWHKDHEHTQDIQGMIKLNADTTIVLNDDLYKINLTDSTNNVTLGLRFEQNENEYQIWKAAIMNILKKFVAVEKATVKRIENAYENATKRGKLRMRPPKGGDIWDEYYFVLTMSEILVMEKNVDGHMEVVDMYDIHPNCSVFETNLGLYAFELVTSKKVLHVMSDSRESTSAWIHAIRASIANSQPEENDPLINAALNRVEEDIFYEVSFLEDKPLGVVLERSGEWAIVKLSNLRDTGVSIGSALTSINGESCILKSYAQTIEKLKNWKPPLHLGFRRAPRKTGYLVKLSRQRRGNSQKNWQRRWFSLAEGRLTYRENENSTEVKGDVPLMGSAVSLMPSSETGRFFCFRLVSGVTSLTMQGETMDEMMDWASMLYHAIAIANGGSHILVMERKREAEEAEKQRAREEAIAARARAEAEAKRAKEEAEAKARAEAEARRKAEEEEARRRAAMAEEERLKLEASERKKKSIDDATTQLTTAMAALDLKQLNDVIENVSGLDIAPEVWALNDARALSASLLAKEEAAKQAKADATAALSAALEVATPHTVDELSHAISRAEEALVEQELVDRARDKLIAMRKEKAAMEEVKAALTSALSFESMDSLVEALMSAATINLQDPLVDTAQNLLARLQAEEKRRAEEEEARLAAEAAALDAELEAEERAAERLSEEMKEEEADAIYNAVTARASVHADVGVDSDEEGRNEDDSEAESSESEDEEDQSASPPMPLPDTDHLKKVAAAAAAGRQPPAPPAGRASPPPATSGTGGPVQLNQVKAKTYKPAVQAEEPSAASTLAPSATQSAPRTSARRSARSSGRRKAASFRSQGRKMKTRQERLEEERKAAEKSVHDTIVTPAEMASIFNAYSRVDPSGKRVIQPLHFSTIWRLVSADKGNLFKEMQMFQKFDKQNDGFLSEEDFVKGWQELARQPGGAITVDKLKDLCGDDKVLL